MNADGSNPQRLTNSAFHETEPAWSPDGTKIAYTRVIDDGPLNLGLLPAADKDVYIMNANGTNNHLIFGGPKEQHDPSWSPDGTKLAITGEGDSIPFGDVVLINPVTGAFIANLTAAGISLSASLSSAAATRRGRPMGPRSPISRRRGRSSAFPCGCS